MNAHKGLLNHFVYPANSIRRWALSLWCAIAFTAILTACAGVPASQVAEKQARAHTELATRYYQVGQVAVAVQEAQIAIKSDASYIPAHTLLALIYAELGQNAQADQFFDQALRLSAGQNTSTTDLRNSYAWYLCQTNRMDEGLNQLSLVLNDPLYGSVDKALVNAAVCSARLGRVDTAESYVKAALDISPNFGAAYLYKGHLEVQKHQLSTARGDWQKAQKYLSDGPELLWLLARIEHAETSGVSSAGQRLMQKFPTSVESTWLNEGRWQWF